MPDPENLDAEEAEASESLPLAGRAETKTQTPCSPGTPVEIDWVLWKQMNAEQRALVAVQTLYLKVREQDNEQTARFLLGIACTAIDALEQSRHSRSLKQAASEWPALVPGGPITGSVWKHWMQGIKAEEIGKACKGVPKSGKADFGKSKPASLARACYYHLESLRSTTPVFYEILEAVNQPAPEYQKKALNLPPLSEASVGDWRDLSMEYLESLDSDWVSWIKRWGGRRQTVQTCSNKKEDKGTRYQDGQRRRNQQPANLDQAAAKSVLSDAMRAGLLAFLHSTEISVKGGPSQS